ncbi:MAG: hypothetical protein JJE47_14810 [Acidimicrobiia bacterium]|nr:hypothetical protein [Acidimicrobiia bacterium]
MDGKLVTEAVSAARRALNELEPVEIPPRLRRIAASSARWLPAPLERTLIEALDEHEWLRVKALEELPEENNGPSRLFLERLDGWETELDGLVAEDASSADQRLIGQLTRDIEGLALQRDQAKDKAKAIQALLDGERADHRQAIAELRDEQKPARHPAPDQSRLIQELRDLNLALSDQLADREMRLEKTRADLLKARRAIPNAESRDSSGRSADPVSLARELDRLMVTARPDAVLATDASIASQGGTTQATTGDELRLPQGITPDSAAAIGYLLGRSQPTWVIVDGYNVSFHVDGAGFSTPTARAKVAYGLAGMGLRASGPMRITVVWDSTEEATEGPAASGVERKFVADADEEVRRLSKQRQGDVVVISTDREIHSGVAPGTLVLWSEAFAEWLRTR